VAPNAEVRPSLGRNLSAGVNANAAVNLIAPGTMYLDRVHQVDLRLARRFTIGRVRLEGNVSAYNLFNANPVLVANYTYSSAATWLTPTAILQGTLVKFGMQLHF
jgi:outer membrane receptor protein involved in Fe transport